MLVVLCLVVIGGFSCAIQPYARTKQHVLSLVRYQHFGSSWLRHCVVSPLALWGLCVLACMVGSCVLMAITLSVSGMCSDDDHHTLVRACQVRWSCMDSGWAWWWLKSCLVLCGLRSDLLALDLHCLCAMCPSLGVEHALQRRCPWIFGLLASVWWVSRVGLLWLLALWTAGHSLVLIGVGILVAFLGGTGQVASPGQVASGVGALTLPAPCKEISFDDGVLWMLPFALWILGVRVLSCVNPSRECRHEDSGSGSSVDFLHLCIVLVHSLCRVSSLSHGGVLAWVLLELGGVLHVGGLAPSVDFMRSGSTGIYLAFWIVGRVGLLWPLASWISGHSVDFGGAWALSFWHLVKNCLEKHIGVGRSGQLVGDSSLQSWFDIVLSGFRREVVGWASDIPCLEVGGGSSGAKSARVCGTVSLPGSMLGLLTCLTQFCLDRPKRAQMPSDGLFSPFTRTASRRRTGGSSSRSWCTVWRWCFTFLLLSLVRVGEASRPGPQTPSTWTMGIANPSGLNGKLDQINHLEGDSWILSETQLSQQGISSFVKGLKMLRSPWKSVVPGAPSPTRQRTDTGTHTGVMFLSKYPARALPHNFDKVAYESARIQVAGMSVANVWVTVGLLYGIPENAHHKQARYQTDSFLAEVVDRVGCQATGPRVIGGDFNFGPSELQQLERLHALGFREVQDLAAWRFGISAQATGRGSRRIDQMWISPELQVAFQGVQVSFDHWADHAAVSASFAVADLSSVVTSWAVPRPFPWPKVWNCQVSFDPSGNLTEQYAQFWSQVETQAKCWNQHHGVFVTKKQCGRAAVLETAATREPCCPVKKARKGDVQPTYMGTSLEHARFFRQLRRLQSLCRALHKGPSTLAGRCNRDETWRAIRRAVGFPGGFGLWWNAKGLVPALVVPLPLVCPSLDFIQGLFLGFQSFVQAYERDLARHRYQHAKHRRANNLAFAFQDCKDDPLPKADTLIDRLEAHAEEVREEDSSVVLVQPVSLLDSVPLVSEGQVVKVVAHHEDQIWLESTDGLTAGSVLSQERPVTSDTAILQRFADAWGPRWVKQSHVQPGQWTQICGFLDRVLQPIQWEYKPWTSDRLISAIRQKKAKAAKGPDGVSQPDLASLPPSAIGVLVQLLDQVESGQTWPAQLANGFVTSLAKRSDAQQVDQFRPVVVYSLLYRVWSTERAREALRSIAAVLPASVQGGVPARQAKTIWYELASALELAYMQGTELHGVLMDIQKAFNNLPRHPLWHALNGLCFPVPTLRAWVNFVSIQTRRFRVRRSVGEPLRSTCGLPEGCALSVFGMVVVDWVLDLWISAP